METEEIKENPLATIQKMRFQIERVERMGGRGSLFGLLEIFQIILAEEHEKDPDEPKTGMYRFKGMEQYGNCVSIKCIYSTVQRCADELNFTKDEFDKLINWYDGREYGPDTKILALAIGWAIKDKKLFTE